METTDPLIELEAMRVLATALQPLGQDSRRMVLYWASEKFLAPDIRVLPQPKTPLSSPRPTPSQTAVLGLDTEATAQWSLENYPSVGDLYHACTPSSDGEKALVISAWLQKNNESEGVDSYSVNSELKNLGYGIGNITRAFDYLIQAKPALMIQVRKSGTSKQARKSFRVTDQGMKRICEMVAQNQASQA
jgi:hypothetical protein